MPCVNPLHDHTADEGDGPMRCNDCGAPIHWDEGVLDYVHDDDEAPPCFLVTLARADLGGSPCQEG